MSISAIGGTPPWRTGQASETSSVTSDAAAASSSTAATNATGLGNFFQQFAADLQSLLTQVQATAAPGTTNPVATPPVATTTAPTGTAPTGTGTGTPAAAVDQATQQQPDAVHHHHHHGGGGPLQQAANQFVGQVAQAFGGTPANGASTLTPANGASALAADIVHALQNYGAFAASPAPGAVSTTA
jgi:hypothetical protein